MEGSEEALATFRATLDEQPSPPISPLIGLCPPRELEKEETVESEFGISSQPDVPDPCHGVPYAEASMKTAELRQQQELLQQQPELEASGSLDGAYIQANSS